MKPTVQSLAAQIEGLQAQIEGLILVINTEVPRTEALERRIAQLEDEVVHQKRINVLLRNGKYSSNTGALSSPIAELRTKARELATQGRKNVVIRGGMLYADGQLVQ